MLIIMQGVPGSGKSTRAEAIAAVRGGTVICSTDRFFVNEQGSYLFDPTKLAENHGKNLADAKFWLGAGYSVIVDNCNVKNEHVAPYVAFAVENGIPVEFVRCEGSYENVHGVPTEVVKRMRREMEELCIEKCLQLVKGT